MKNSVIVTENSSIKNIQHLFNEIYPFLKIEFFKKRQENSMAKPEKIDSGKILLRFSELKESLELSIQPATTVLQLEQIVDELFNLDLQIYRKAGSGWVETLHTEHWTLEQQNEEGRFFSLPGIDLSGPKKEGPPASYRSE